MSLHRPATGGRARCFTVDLGEILQILFQKVLFEMTLNTNFFFFFFHLH